MKHKTIGHYVVCGPFCQVRSRVVPVMVPNGATRLNERSLGRTNSEGAMASLHVPWSHASPGSRELVPMCKTTRRRRTSQPWQLHQEGRTALETVGLGGSDAPT